MQKRSFFRLWSLAVALVLIFTGCNDNDPVFSVEYGGRVIQKNYSYGEGEFEAYLSLYLRFDAYNGEFEKFEIYKDSYPLYGRMYSNAVYEIVPDNYGESPNGTYTYQATSKTGEIANGSFPLNAPENEFLGEMNVSEFKYESGKLSITMEKVDNAGYCGYSINPVVDNMPDTRIFESVNYKGVSSSDTEWVIEVDISSTLQSFKSVYEFDTFIISPVAISSKAIYLYGDSKTLNYGASSFVGEEE